MTATDGYPKQAQDTAQQKATAEQLASRELFEAFEETLLKVLYSEVLLSLLLQEEA